MFKRTFPTDQALVCPVTGGVRLPWQPPPHSGYGTWNMAGANQNQFVCLLSLTCMNDCEVFFLVCYTLKPLHIAWSGLPGGLGGGGSLPPPKKKLATPPNITQ